MIDRLTTQRACLEFAAGDIAARDGPVLEIGLGKGRTYSHLRALLPRREIFAFDREVHAPADAQPDAAHILLGDFRETLPAAAAVIGAPAALIHADIGSEKPARDAKLAAAIAPHLAVLAAPAALVLCDRALPVPAWTRLPLPKGAGDWEYFVYRVPQ
ncbi:MAG: hypothetical protein GY791_00125 [Alphaproteobacteria bacterium]|nr:hypothetical protein [Alphaproteobacteria bacterium]